LSNTDKEAVGLIPALELASLTKLYRKGDLMLRTGYNLKG